MEYILVIDQGTTSTRAVCYDKLGEVIYFSQKEYEQIFPKVGYVEQDLNIVLGSLNFVLKDVLNKLGDNILGIGIANQRETTILFNKEGKPLYNAISWQCKRTNYLCEQLKNNGYENMIKAKTGLIIDPYFSASKMYWLLHNVPFALDKALKEELYFGTMDTYLMYYLSDGKIFKTDITNASRTMLYNIYDKRWDDELLKIFDIPKYMLPEVCPSKHLYGYTSKNSIFKKEIPILGVAGDQQASLFGHLCTEVGDTKVTYGTGCFMLTNIGKNIPKTSKLLTTVFVMYDDNINYAVEGSVFFAGSLVKWLRDNLGLIKTSSESEDLALKVDDTKGVYIVPAFTGLGAPYWDKDALGMIVNLTEAVNKNHLVRAALEAINYQVYDVLELVKKELGINISKIYVDGGASKNNFLMQNQADILKMQVVRPKNIEKTSLGIFYLVALGLNIYSSLEQLKEIKRSEKTFYENMPPLKRDLLIKGWHEAVRKVLK